MGFNFFPLSRIKLKIRWKLLAVLLLFITFALALTNSLWIYSIRPLLKEKIIESQEEIAKHAAFRIEEFVQAKVRNLILHSQAEVFFTKNIPAAEVELAIILRQDGDLKEVSFIDQGGKELATLTPEKIFAQDELRDQSESSKFILPTFRYGAEYRSRVYFSAEGEPMITLSVPIIVPVTRQNIEEISTIEPAALQRGAGEILGVLAAEASLKDILFRSSESFDAGPGGHIYLVDGEGKVIAHPGQEFSGNMDVLRADIIEKHIAQDEQIFQETGGHPFEQILTDQGAGESGEEVLATLYEIPRLRWGVLVQQPISEVFAPLRRVERFALFLFLGGIAMTIVVSLWFSYLLTKSIEMLHKGVEMIGLGHFGYRVQVHTNDEMQELAEAFNGMIKGIEEAQERDEEVSKMKSEFLSIAAHQLRTPLSALKWVLNLTLEGDLGKLQKKQKELLGKGYETNERMIMLVNDLLDVVRIEEGRFDYKLEKGAVVEIMESIVRETRVLAEKKGVQLFFHKPSRRLPEVALDLLKFRLAVANIIDNAVQYTPTNGRIDIEFVRKDNEILVSVKDTGIGITADQLSRVFTKFFRADNAMRVVTAGSGLGLFIAKNIIEKHGGKIWIESQEGKGTTVYFTIPIAHS